MEVVVNVPREENLDVLKHLHETQRKDYWDALNICSKAMTFYLAIAAGVLGYIFTKELDPPLPRDIAVAGLVISGLFLVSLVAGVRGVLRQLARVVHLENALVAALGVNATHVVHSGVSGNNGGYHTFPLLLEELPNEDPS